MKSKQFLITVVLFLFIQPLSASENKGPVPGQFIVKLSNSTKVDILKNALSSDVSLSKISNDFSSNKKQIEALSNYYTFTSADTSLTQSDIINILGSDNIEFIEPDYYGELFDYPQDPLFEHQWFLNNTGQSYYGIDRREGEYNDSLVLKTGTSGKDISLTEYYENPPQEHTKVVVAIIDTGVDYLHPDLNGQIWHNTDEISNNGIDDDHNGYVDDVVGYDLAGTEFDFFEPTPDNDPVDTYGHGTHVAGIVGAASNNIGVSGVCNNVAIMPVKIAPDGRPTFTISVAAKGILYAVNNGAQVINISWGTPFESTLLREVIAFARANNVFICIAPGNFGNSDIYYPAGFDSTFVVAASNSDGYMTYFTSYGPHVDIVAPGEDILSLRAQGTDMYALSLEPNVRFIGDDSLYYLSDGTSMASPVAAGAGALLLSIAPELNVNQIEQLLIDGADDLLDPFNQEDSLPGYDTLSGHGILNIDNSIALLNSTGLSFISPRKRERYTTELPIKINPRGNLNQAWLLFYSVGEYNRDWQLLASGTSIPADSIVYTIDTSFANGVINLKIDDQSGNAKETQFYYITRNRLSLTSPTEGENVRFDIKISGEAYGPQYDSMLIFYRYNGTQEILMRDTKEHFDSLIYNWKVSGIDTGQYSLYMFGYFDNGVMLDSVRFHIESVFAQGWPKSIGTKTTLSPIVDDIDNDNLKELIVPSADGLYAFDAYGNLKPGFPTLAGKDLRSMPAIYDVDRDGSNDIIITDDSALYVINGSGELLSGWPQYCKTGGIGLGYGYPNPTVVQLGIEEDSAIAFVNTIGQIMAYEFNGDSYFYSLQGIFSDFNPRAAAFSSNSKVSPYITSLDIDQNGLNEVLASYSSAAPYSGVGLFEGRTGLPLMDETDPIIIRESQVFGTALTDLDNDSYMEIITLAEDTNRIMSLKVKTHLYDDYGAFPIQFPELDSWFLASPITLADLNLDGVAEIMFTAFSFDFSYLYILNADGSAYSQIEGLPYGVAFVDETVFGIPVAANLVGDANPEIVFRSGYLLPGTGPEQVYMFSNSLEPIEGWPITTPAVSTRVFSTQFAPLIDDLDSDGLVEMVLFSDNSDVLVWDFNTSYDNGNNKVRYLGDNLNSNTFDFRGITTDINDLDNQSLPQSFTLNQNYPNPFNPTTIISFEIPRKSETALHVYNILGQKVTTIVDGELSAGHYSYEFDASDFASGMYFYSLQTEEYEETKKMVLIK
ncbi:MAG: T9SS C-terminal target domain-containing protein [Calditrichaeota bacterium]|nr:MAG: T9SS C-terminal target domain-containing protein [Calditrichota bacterium]